MKQKLFLLALAICLFACLLTISVSAVTGSTSDEFGEVTYVSGVNANTQIVDKTSRVVLLNADGTYTTYPAYYISDVKLQWQGTVQYKFDALNAALGTSYDMDSIVRVEILCDSTVMNQNGGSYQNRKNLKEVVFPEGTQIKEIGGQQFKGSGLEKICIPATVTTIGVLTFEDCQSLKEITFAPGFAMTSLPNQMFSGCTSLEKISIPDSVESIGRSFFGFCSSLAQVRFGKGLKTVGDQLFALCKNDMVIYAPAAFLSDKASINMSDFTYDSGNLHLVTLFFEGTKAQAQALIDKATHRGLMEATLVEWDGKEDSYYIPENPTAWTIVYSYNMCAHAWSGEKEAKVTDFYSPIEIGVACVKCGTMQTESTISPIFECLGYSAKEMPDINGKYSIAIGYRVNKEAYSQYAELCNGAFEFGIVVCAVKATGKQPLAVENGAVIAVNESKTLTAKQNGFLHSYFDIKVMNITKGMNGQELIASLYVLHKENIYYLNENGQDQSAKAIKINV